MIENPKKVLSCGRCGKRFIQNARFKGIIPVDDTLKTYDITSISLMGCRRIPINSVSLCDDCIEEFLDWFGPTSDKFLKRPNPLYTKNYMEGDDYDE